MVAAQVVSWGVLTVLEGVGLVERDIDGRMHRCSLSVAPLQVAENWLQHNRAFWTGTLESLAQHVEPPSRKGKRSK